MIAALRLPKASYLLELAFAAAVVAGILWSASFLFAAGYLPRPFFHNPVDTFMDWFNTAFYADNSGAYSVWRSVYPPISFAFLKVFSLHACYGLDSVHGRDCDWFGRDTLLGIFLLNILIVYKAYVREDRTTAWMRTIAAALGFPMLFALDRGNLIIPCFACFALAQGRILKSARLKWIAMAVAVNFKPYLILAGLYQGLRGRWRWVEGSVVALAMVYVASYAMVGAGTPAQVIRNTIEFGDRNAIAYFDAAYYASSFNPLVGLISSAFPFMNVIGSRPMEAMQLGFTVAIRVGQLGVVLAFLGVMWRPYAVKAHRIAALTVAIMLTSIEPGGYAMTFLVFLTLYEKWDSVAAGLALTCAFLLCVPWDFTIYPVAREVQDSYLTNRTVGYDIGVSIGEFVRPALVLVIQYALSAGAIIDIVRFRRVVGTPPPRPVAPVTLAARGTLG